MSGNLDNRIFKGVHDTWFVFEPVRHDDKAAGQLRSTPFTLLTRTLHGGSRVVSRRVISRIAILIAYIFGGLSPHL